MVFFHRGSGERNILHMLSESAISAYSDHDRKVEETKRLIVDELPEDNYEVLKYVISFLTAVSEPSASM